MAQKKQTFRFRIPWLSGTHAARPVAEPLPRRPKDRSESPTKPDTNIPIQRPQSPPSPTKTQGAPRAEPQKESPSQPSFHGGSPSRVSIVSPSPKTQPQPPSHSALDEAIKVSKLAPEESTEPASSASEQEKQKMVMSEPMPQESEPTQHQSPSHLASDGAIEVPKPAAQESTQPESSISEQEKEKMVVSEPMPQEAKPKVNSPLKAILKPPDTSSQSENLSTQLIPSFPKATLETQSKSPETFFQPERMSTQPAGFEPQQASSVPSSSSNSKAEPAASHSQPPSPLASHSEPLPQETEPKMNSPLKIIPKSPETSSQHENLSTQPTAVLGDEKRSTAPKAPWETQSRLLQSEEKEKAVHQPIKAGKSKDRTSVKPVRRTIASASGTQVKDLFTRAFHADKKQHEAQETAERKIMFATSNAGEKDIRVVSSADPGNRNVSSISPERPVSSNEEKAPMQKGIKDDISKFVHKLTTVHPMQPMDDKQFSIITLAGDNRGATMHVGSEPTKKEGSIHIHRAYKTDPEDITEVTTDGEENNNTKKDTHSSTKNDEVGKAYVNSNIQSINNSMMFHGSITERDPGVQVTLPQKQADPIKPDDDKLGLETPKTEFNISRAQKLTYQPMVRRRCLRGLFVEPSDSDPDNPDKPRRHGCKFSCDKNKKVEDIENL